MWEGEENGEWIKFKESEGMMKIAENEKKGEMNEVMKMKMMKNNYNEESEKKKGEDEWRWILNENCDWKLEKKEKSNLDMMKMSEKL